MAEAKRAATFALAARVARSLRRIGVEASVHGADVEVRTRWGPRLLRCRRASQYQRKQRVRSRGRGYEYVYPAACINRHRHGRRVTADLWLAEITAGGRRWYVLLQQSRGTTSNLHLTPGWQRRYGATRSLRQAVGAVTTTLGMGAAEAA